MGVDQIVRIDVGDDELLDAAATGSLLAAVIRALGARLVFAAQRSAGGGSGLVPAFLARALDAAYLSNAVSVRVERDAVEIQRRLGHGDRQMWAARLPVVVAFDAAINVPRYPRVGVRLAARRRAVDPVSPAAVNAPVSSLPRSTALVRLTPARFRPKKTALPAASQSAADRMRALMTGGIAGKKDRRVLKGPVAELTAETLSFLEERNLLDD
jgi:electron transfer flavoprotein alpha/beta subunit